MRHLLLLLFRAVRSRPSFVQLLLHLLRASADGLVLPPGDDREDRFRIEELNQMHEEALQRMSDLYQGQLATAQRASEQKERQLCEQLSALQQRLQAQADEHQLELRKHTDILRHQLQQAQDARRTAEVDLQQASDERYTQDKAKLLDACKEGLKLVQQLQHCHWGKTREVLAAIKALNGMDSVLVVSQDTIDEWSDTVEQAAGDADPETRIPILTNTLNHLLEPNCSWIRRLLAAKLLEITEVTNSVHHRILYGGREPPEMSRSEARLFARDDKFAYTCAVFLHVQLSLWSLTAQRGVTLRSRPVVGMYKYITTAEQWYRKAMDIVGKRELSLVEIQLTYHWCRFASISWTKALNHSWRQCARSFNTRANRCPLYQAR
jgi:hypothetical protein